MTISDSAMAGHVPTGNSRMRSSHGQASHPMETGPPPQNDPVSGRLRPQPRMTKEALQLALGNSILGRAMGFTLKRQREPSLERVPSEQLPKSHKSTANRGDDSGPRPRTVENGIVVDDQPFRPPYTAPRPVANRRRRSSSAAAPQPTASTQSTPNIQKARKPKSVPKQAAPAKVGSAVAKDHGAKESNRTAASDVELEVGPSSQAGPPNRSPNMIGDDSAATDHRPSTGLSTTPSGTGTGNPDRQSAQELYDRLKARHKQPRKTTLTKRLLPSNPPKRARVSRGDRGSGRTGGSAKGKGFDFRVPSSGRSAVNNKKTSSASRAWRTPTASQALRAPPRDVGNEPHAAPAPAPAASSFPPGAPLAAAAEVAADDAGSQIGENLAVAPRNHGRNSLLGSSRDRNSVSGSMPTCTGPCPTYPDRRSPTHTGTGTSSDRDSLEDSVSSSSTPRTGPSKHKGRPFVLSPTESTLDNNIASPFVNSLNQQQDRNNTAFHFVAGLSLPESRDNCNKSLIASNHPNLKLVDGEESPYFAKQPTYSDPSPPGNTAGEASRSTTRKHNSSQQVTDQVHSSHQSPTPSKQNKDKPSLALRTERSSLSKKDTSRSSTKRPDPDPASTRLAAQKEQPAPAAPIVRNKIPAMPPAALFPPHQEARTYAVIKQEQQAQTPSLDPANRYITVHEARIRTLANLEEANNLAREAMANNDTRVPWEVRRKEWDSIERGPGEGETFRGETVYANGERHVFLVREEWVAASDLPGTFDINERNRRAARPDPTPEELERHQLLVNPYAANGVFRKQFHVMSAIVLRAERVEFPEDEEMADVAAGNHMLVVNGDDEDEGVDVGGGGGDILDDAASIGSDGLISEIEEEDDEVNHADANLNLLEANLNDVDVDANANDAASIASNNTLIIERLEEDALDGNLDLANLNAYINAQLNGHHAADPNAHHLVPANHPQPEAPIPRHQRFDFRTAAHSTWTSYRLANRAALEVFLDLTRPRTAGLEAHQFYERDVRDPFVAMCAEAEEANDRAVRGDHRLFELEWEPPRGGVFRAVEAWPYMMVRVWVMCSDWEGPVDLEGMVVPADQAEMVVGGGVDPREENFWQELAHRGWGYAQGD